jgi:hypothetical protein
MTLPLQFVTVRDQDGVVAIGQDDLVRYAGPGQIVASALCLRLFARSFADLSPEGPPLRDEIRVLLAFPGPGILDGVEMITRARTRGRLVVDPAAGPASAPRAPVGRFFFAVAIGARSRGYALAPGFFTEAFLTQVTRHQEGAGSAAERAAYLGAKYDLIGRLCGTPLDQVFHAVEFVWP